MFMSVKDDFIRQRYFQFIVDNNIDIVSNFFERMEVDRKLTDEKIKKQKNSRVNAFDLSKFLSKKKVIQKEAIQMH